MESLRLRLYKWRETKQKTSTPYLSPPTIHQSASTSPIPTSIATTLRSTISFMIVPSHEIVLDANPGPRFLRN